MSEENLELVRSVYEQGYAQRTVEIPGIEDRVASDYLFHPRHGFPAQTAYRLDQMVDFWADLDRTFDDYSLSPQGYESLGPAYVLVTLRQTARLRGSDQHLVEPLYMLWELAEGKLQETWAYTDKAQALEAAELQE